MAVRPRRGRVEAPRYARHFLASAAVAASIVEEAGIAPGDLVLDLGAGRGMLTAPLVARGARVVAVELEAASAAALRRYSGAEVVEDDLLAYVLPREPFKVVSNLPFHLAAAVLRRLLDDPRVPLRQADLVVEWTLAAKRAAVWPSTRAAVVWGAWYEVILARRLPRSAFAPPPSVDAAVLRIARRSTPLVPVEEARAFHAFVARGFAGGRPLRRSLREEIAPRRLKRLARELAFGRDAAGRDLDVRQWVSLYEQRA